MTVGCQPLVNSHKLGYVICRCQYGRIVSGYGLLSSPLVHAQTGVTMRRTVIYTRLKTSSLQAAAAFAAAGALLAFGGNGPAARTSHGQIAGSDRPRLPIC